MTAAYWIAVASLVAALAFAAWVDYRAAERLRVAREQRDEWRRIAVRAVTSDAVSAATYAVAALRHADRERAGAKVERGAM